MVNKRIILDLVAAINDKGMTMKTVANALGLDMQEVKSWLKLDAEPPKATVEKIKKFLENPENPEFSKKQEKIPEKKEPAQKPQPEQEKNPEPVKTKPKKKDPFMAEPVEEEPTKVSKEPKKETPKTSKKESPKKTAPATTKKEEPAMPTKEKKSDNKAKKEERKFFRTETEALIRNVTGIKKADAIALEAVTAAGNLIANTIENDVRNILLFLQDTATEAFREPDPLPEKIQQLLDAAEAASDEGIEMATTILKKFAK